jgi:hypothetical protein
MTEELGDDDDATEATHLAIGRFIDQFGSIEFTLRYYLTLAVKLDFNYMDAIITHDFGLLCTAVTTVYSEILRTEEDHRQLKTVISKCRALNDTRVKVVHGQWFAFSRGGTVAHKSRQTLRQQDTTGMAELLEKQTKAAVGVFVDLQVLLSKCEDNGEQAKN